MEIIYKLSGKDELEDILNVLDNTGEGFLAIIDQNEKFIGVITDGDIRRAFLNKQSDISEIINTKPITANESQSKEYAIYLLKKYHRRHLPIINDKGFLIDIIKLDNWAEIFRPNKVVIMAGGLGSRLGDLTKETPKPMLPIGNKPILENLIKTLKQSGFNDFFVSVNFKSEVIKKYFGNGEKFGVNIQYLEEKKRLGTAGALSLIPTIPKENILVVNGDILSSINFEQMLNQHLEKKSIATMAVSLKSEQIQFGVIDFDQNNNIKTIVEKPISNYYINAGAYVLSPESLLEIPKDEFFDMPSLFKKLIKQQKVTSSYIIDGYWLDIGLKKDYFEAVEFMKDET